MTNQDKLKIAKRVITAIQELDPSPQRDVLRALSVTDEHVALRKVLAILEPLTLLDRGSVTSAVEALLGHEPDGADEGLS